MEDTHFPQQLDKDSLITTFGVGCFHFALRDPKENTLEQKTYLQKITSALSELSSVTDVDVHASGEVSPNASAHVGCFPELGNNSKLQFTLFIPMRIQADHFNYRGCPPETFTEEFRVYVVGTLFGFPVAFVEPLEPAENPKPSDAVLTVREFLREQLDKINSPIKLEVVPPTPMDADFAVYHATKTKRSGSISLGSINVIPIGQVFIAVNNAHNLDTAVIMNLIIAESAVEASLFYRISKNSNDQKWEWGVTEQMFRSLAELLRKPGIAGVISRWMRLSRLINDITLSMAEYQARNMEQKDFVGEVYDYIYTFAHSFRPFKSFIDAQLQQLPSRPNREITDVLKFAEARRTMSFQLIVNIVVGLLGGIAGAITTLILQK